MNGRPLPTLLLTAFGPFGGDGYNPTQHALDPVAEAVSGHARVVAEVLRVEYAAACTRVRELIRTHRPDVVVGLGLAAGRAAITPERVAINLAEARIPDEAGAQPLGVPLVDGTDAAHFSTLPVAAMVQAVDAAGVPAAVSYSAGAFVCNAVMYAALEEIRVLEEGRTEEAEGAAGSGTDEPAVSRTGGDTGSRAGGAAVAGFIHVPQAVEAGGTALSQAQIDRGLIAAVRAAVERRGAPPVAPTGALDAATEAGRLPGLGATD